jgi:glycosyltransferase involved in cell wall biosynthesis
MGRVPDLVSVVLPVRNGRNGLRAQLTALADQDFAGPIEVVVADNGSRDGSLQAAHVWARDRANARVIDASRRRGPAAARNAGVATSAGDFLAFCDADDVVSRSWLRELVAGAADADLVGGSFETTMLNSETVRARFDLLDPAEPHLCFLPSAAGGNLGIWRDVFMALGGFDERRRTGEDVALVWRAQLLGYRYRPCLALVHKRFPAGLRGTARRFFAYGQGDARLYHDFASAGMPRRGREETLTLWHQLAAGFPGVPEPGRWGRWTIVLALSCGRLAGSARHGVLFT